jgi:hypothetical protein
LWAEKTNRRIIIQPILIDITYGFFTIERIEPDMSDNPYQKPSPFGGQQNQNGQNGNPQQGPFGQQQNQGGFPQQPQQGGFPQQNQGGFPQQPQQGGFPQQGGYQQAPQGYQQPQQFGQQNGYPQQQNQYQPGYNQQPGVPPQGPPNNNKSLWIIIGSVVGGIILIGILVIVAAFALGGGKSENTSTGGNDRGTSAENPISLEPLKSTGNPNQDTKFDKGYSGLDIPTLTQDQARGVAVDTCKYLKTDPTREDFQDNFLGGKSQDEAYDLGQALGVGIPIYCPSEMDTLTNIIPVE